MKEQITIEELLALEPGSYLLYDMRDRYSFDYGAIPGAEHKEQAAILEAADSLPKDMPVIICCKSGLLSDAVAEELRTPWGAGHEFTGRLLRLPDAKPAL